MKITKYLSLALLALPLMATTACDDYNDQFEGLDEQVVPTDVQTLEYTLTEADYALLASKGKSMVSDSELQAQLVAAGKAKAFSATNDAKVLLPYFFKYSGGSFYTLSNGSSIKATYNYQDNAPEILAQLGATKSVSLKAADYKLIWNSDTDFIAAVTPATKSKIADVVDTSALEEGDYVAVDYKYATEEPKFGDEDDATFEYTSVLGNAVKDDVVEVRGYISGVCTQGVTLTDATGTILLYKSTGYTIGQEVTVKGTISSYNKGFQIQGGEIIDNGTTKEVFYPVPTVLDGAGLDALVAARTSDEYMKFVKLEGTMAISGNYYNIKVDGATTADGSFYGITDEHKAKVADGATVTVYGWLSSISGGKHANIVATHINEVPACKYTSVLGNAALNDEVEVRGYISGKCTQGVTLTDATGSVLLYKTTDHEIGEEVTVAGKITAYNKGFQIQGGTVTTTGECNVTYPNPVVLDGAGLDALVAGRTENGYLQYVQLVGTMAVSGNYYNINVDGATASDGSFYGITDEFKAIAVNEAQVRVTGWFSSISGGKHVNIIATNVEQVAGTAVKAVKMPATEKKFILYQFVGGKLVEQTAIAVVQPADYVAMGFTNETISNSDKYLPKFLNATFPYAQTGDVKDVLFKISSGWIAVEYSYDGTMWILNNNLTENTDQFVRTNGVWRYNPSVKIILPPSKSSEISKTYMKAIVDWVIANIDTPMGLSAGAGFTTSYQNNEYYTGASYYQNNVDWRTGSAIGQFSADSYQAPELVAAGIAFAGDGYGNFSEDQGKILTLMQKRLCYVFGQVLPTLHPDAKAIDGVEILYTIQFGVYVGNTISAPTHQLIYKVVGDAKFEFVNLAELKDGKWKIIAKNVNGEWTVPSTDEYAE